MPFICSFPKYTDDGISCKCALYGISSLIYATPLAFSGIAPTAVIVAFAKVIPNSDVMRKTPADKNDILSSVTDNKPVGIAELTPTADIVASATVTEAAPVIESEPALVIVAFAVVTFVEPVIDKEPAALVVKLDTDKLDTPAIDILAALLTVNPAIVVLDAPVIGKEPTAVTVIELSVRDAVPVIAVDVSEPAAEIVAPVIVIDDEPTINNAPAALIVALVDTLAEPTIGKEPAALIVALSSVSDAVPVIDCAGLTAIVAARHPVLVSIVNAPGSSEAAFSSRLATA